MEKDLQFSYIYQFLLFLFNLSPIEHGKIQDRRKAYYLSQSIMAAGGEEGGRRKEEGQVAGIF